MSDDWTGPRDGPFRGKRLFQCKTHPLCWLYEGTECAVCESERIRRTESDQYRDRLKELIACGEENLRLHGLLAQARQGTLRGDGA